MRRSLITSVLAASLFLGLGATAFAKTHHHPPPPPPPPPAWSWTGFYIGGNVGYSWGRSDTTVSFFDPTGFLGSAQSTFSLDGVVGGGQVGYNWQTGNWVWGVVADIQGTGQRGSGTYICTVTVCASGPITDSLRQKLDWYGTVRGRVGVLSTPDILWYATGGLAYGQIKTSESIVGPFQSSTLNFSTVKTGWTVGTGLEGHIAGNWTWMVQYLFVDFGQVSGTGTTSVITSIFGFCDTHVCPLSPGFSSKITDNIIQVGVNLKLP